MSWGIIEHVSDLEIGDRVRLGWYSTDAEGYTILTLSYGTVVGFSDDDCVRIDFFNDGYQREQDSLPKWSSIDLRRYEAQVFR